MTAYLLSPAATADVEQIAAYLDEQAPHATNAVLSELRKAMRRIAARPGIGHLRSDLTDEPLCFFSVWNCLVFYRATKPIQVVRVLHGARDIERLLKRRKA